MLVAVVVLLSVVCGLNLLLTFGVIRRLRAYSAALGGAGDGTGPVPGGGPMMPAGGEPGPFDEAVTTDGVPLSRADLPGMVVGFFSQRCTGCRERLPHFVELVRALGRERVVAVVAGDADANRDAIDLLDPVARVLVEPDQGPVQRAFAVRGYPAMCLIDSDGRIAVAAMRVEDLRAALPGPAALPEPAVSR